jgi:[ribosomal protein S18]-alanine N-acetyltransferase
MSAFAIAVIESDGVGHITTIGVAPEYRRRGLARLMLHEIERSFLARGVTTVRLEVRVGNSPAQKLYEQLGYVVVQRMSRYYSNGDDGYLMVKSLETHGLPITSS